MKHSIYIQYSQFLNNLTQGSKYVRIECIHVCIFLGSQDSIIGIVIHYGLDGPGIKSHYGRDFPDLSWQALKPTQPPTKWIPGLSRGVKRPGHDIDHPPPSSAEVKKRVELYIYSPSGTSWPVLGWTLCIFLNVSKLSWHPTLCVNYEWDNSLCLFYNIRLKLTKLR
jgi:hypothetical protein